MGGFRRRDVQQREQPAQAGPIRRAGSSAKRSRRIRERPRAPGACAPAITRSPRETTRPVRRGRRSRCCRTSGRTTARRSSARIRGRTNRVGRERRSGFSHGIWSVMRRYVDCLAGPSWSLLHIVGQVWCNSAELGLTGCLIVCGFVADQCVCPSRRRYSSNIHFKGYFGTFGAQSPREQAYVQLVLQFGS
ncbi:hypothetical protein JG687_00013677 [Phytophthora cactorum]|uniref:Uncharacterized protein n=1 Tax=Phytophthora cactorum TaxID=29920 RepID=A0A8T1TYB3_9STRA|nr:hypothetical protein JG687_00013677 [Phytophthora cactorum]